MKRYLGLVLILIVVVNLFPFLSGSIFGFLIPVIFFLAIFNTLLKKRPFEKGNPWADRMPSQDEVASEIKEKFDTRNPYDTVATYDPALVEINRFDDLVQTSTIKMTLLNPPKKDRPEETMMFLNEGEQIILEPPTSMLATVAVYDRSKHLLGYVPKTRNGTVMSLINSERIVKGYISKLTKTLLTNNIEIEIEYKQR